MTKRIGTMPGATEYSFDEAERVFGPAKVLAAANNVKMWHQKLPDRVMAIKYTFPATMQAIGRAVEILYVSDKWEPDGKGYPYEHDFESRPTVYARPGAGLIEGAARQNFAGSRPTPTARLLGGPVDGEFAFPVLAVVDRLTFETLDGERRSITYRSHDPVMCCTNDKNTVVILSSRADVGPVFIKGGKMKVTERGIVK